MLHCGSLCYTLDSYITLWILILHFGSLYYTVDPFLHVWILILHVWIRILHVWIRILHVWIRILHVWIRVFYMCGSVLYMCGSVPSLTRLVTYFSPGGPASSSGQFLWVHSGTGFPLSTPVPPLRVIPPLLRTRSSICHIRYTILTI